MINLCHSYATSHNIPFIGMAMSSYLASNGSVSHHQTFNIKSDKIIKKLLGLKIPEPELDPAVLAGGVTGIGGTLANKGVGTGTEPEDAATDSVVSFVVVSRGAGLEGLLVSNGVGAVLEDLLSENGRAAMGGSFALEASCLIGET